MLLYWVVKKIDAIPICKIEIIDLQKVSSAKEGLVDDEKNQSMARIFKLLGEPTRLKIILSLFDNELCVCDLAAVVESTVSAVSHQLRLLRNSRLVKFRKAGKMVYYSIEDAHIKQLIEQTKQHVEEN